LERGTPAQSRAVSFSKKQLIMSPLRGSTVLNLNFYNYTNPSGLATKSRRDEIIIEGLIAIDKEKSSPLCPLSGWSYRVDTSFYL
jgi:hypothetical protein